MYETANPYGYNPYGAIYTNPYIMQQQQQAQQMAQNPQMQQGVRVSGITVVQVPTIEQVEQIQMLPGERKIVFVQNDPDFLAIRVSDNAGFVRTEYRRSTVYDPKAAQQMQQAQYATAESVDTLRQEIEAMKQMIGGKRNDTAKPANHPVARGQ